MKSMERGGNSLQERRLKQQIQNAEYEIAKLKREIDMTPSLLVSYRGRTLSQLRNRVWQKEREIEGYKTQLWKIR